MISGLLGMVLMGSLVAGQAGAVPARDAGAPSTTGRRVGGDNRIPKFVQKWQGQKAAAADAVLRGEAKVRKNGTVRLANGEFVEYAREDEDHIVTLLVDFTDPEQGEIEKPNRKKDNATYWEPNFDRAHYQEMLFSESGNPTGLPSMRDFYLEQSDGRYTVNGQVSEWVSIDAPESEFGANSDLGDGSDDLNGPYFRVIGAGLDTLATQDADVNWDPAVVDVWDRYDCDEDGNFDEPDGYVDHFQMVHAGQGEEEGGGAQGGDAIWSHRSFANYSPGDGPAGFDDACKQGGYPVPGTDLWVGDYTIEPENGAVGVFSHEFGHDLGLPDMYDTSYAGESSVEFWSLMSGGSWGSRPGDPIGTAPTHMDAWSKTVLGWVRDTDLGVYDYDGPADAATSFKLGPAEGASAGRHQAIQVNLPDYTRTEQLQAPDGEDPFYYFSGADNDLDNSMTHELAAPLAADTEMTFRTWYDIEEDWDYAYVEASSNGGENWVALDGTLSTDEDPNGQNFGHGITGFSFGWVDGAYTVPAGTNAVRFRYWTDGAFVAPGFIVDRIHLGDEIDDDGADTAEWELVGFQQVEGGEVTNTYFRYYLIESRNYMRNDKSLRGAYNFIKGNWLEKNAYADGVLIWYRDSRYSDNDVGAHPGHGQILVVDSHPKPAVMPDGENFWRTRWQTWDSTFGTESHKIRLTQVIKKQWKSRKYQSGPVRVFHDTRKNAYWSSKIPDASTKTAGSGLWVKVKGSGDGGNYTILIK